jgi:transcriptional regulator with XRE-family HTH domain
MRTQVSVGELLKTWRTTRRYSQLELANRAEISQRHLSFMESGRSIPSREMLLRIARHLDVPRRERNRLLVAAGFAPVYRERRFDDPELLPVRTTVQRLLTAYEPFPALAVDRHWTMVLANRSASLLLGGISPRLTTPPVNVLRASLHPEGLAPHIVNLPQWREHVLSRLASQIEASADPVLHALFDELSGYPADTDNETEAPKAEDDLATLAVPLVLDHGGRTLRFLSTTTVFGTPVDVTLSELAIESFLPADQATSRALDELVNR